MVSKFHTRTNIIQNRNSHFLNFVWGEGEGEGQFQFIIFINENKPLTITIIDFFSSKTFKLFSSIRIQ